MLGELIRKYGFWTIDFVKKGQIRKHYNDIKDICENPNNDDRVHQYLTNLLTHATETTEFYKAYKNFRTIEDFAIIDKNIIRYNEDKMLSVNYSNKKLYKMSTSGSTGTPFTVKQDANKKKRVLAEVTYFGKFCGYNIGERLGYLRTWTESNRKTPIDSIKKNIIMLNSSKLDDNSLEKVRQRLSNDKKIRCILGYASSLDILSKYLLKKNDRPQMFNIKTIISGSEVLSETTRVNLKKVFGCDVVSRYSNQENGILAQEPIGNNYFVINKASYFIEFLKLNSDVKAQPGELARVVITDLFNYAMPIIRYDTVDLAIVKTDAYHGNVISSIEGRKRDFIYDASGNLLSPSAITINMWKYDQIKQFQFIQNSRDSYTLILNGSERIHKDEDFVVFLKEVLGDNAKITIEHVTGIPLLQSGKYQQVICKYNPSN